MKDFLKLEEKEQFEFLGEEFFVAVSKEHRFGTDSLLLADFAKILHKDVVADFGVGCGIISVLICKKYKPKKVFAFDILKSATDLAEKSVKRSNLEKTVTIINKDIKKLGVEYHDMFDKIVCNPPYFSLNSGKISDAITDRIIRHELTLTIDEVCSVALKLLRFGGSLFLSCCVERLSDVFFSMRKNCIEPKRLQFCAKNKDTAPWLFLVEGRKKGKPFLKVLPNYFVEG